MLIPSTRRGSQAAFDGNTMIQQFESHQSHICRVQNPQEIGVNHMALDQCIFNIQLSHYFARFCPSARKSLRFASCQTPFSTILRQNNSHTGAFKSWKPTARWAITSCRNHGSFLNLLWCNGTRKYA